MKPIRCTCEELNQLEFVADWDPGRAYVGLRRVDTKTAESAVITRKDARRLHAALGRWLAKPKKRSGKDGGK